MVKNSAVLALSRVKRKKREQHGDYCRYDNRRDYEGSGFVKSKSA